MVEWVVDAARDGGRGAGRCGRPAGRRGGRGAARRRRGRRAARGRGHGRRRARGPGRRARGGRRGSASWSSPATSRSSPRSRSAGCSRSTASAAPPRRCSRPTSSTPPATAASCATATGDVEQDRRDQAHRGAHPEELAIREVNLGTYAFDAATLFEALDEVELDERRALPDRRLPADPPRTGGTIAAHITDDADAALGVNDRAGLMAGRGGRPAPHHRGARARGRDLPRNRARRGVEAGVTIGRDTDDRPRRSLLGATTRRRGLRARPAHDRCATPRSATARRVIHSVRRSAPRSATGAHDRAVRLPAARHGRARGRQGRHLRRGEELRHRRRREGAAPLVHRRRRRGRGQPTSARAPSPPTTTAARSTARSSERA